MKKFAVLGAVATILTAAPAIAGPLIVTGNTGNASTQGLDGEWSVRARNFDNRGGTWKPIIFGSDSHSNNNNAVSSNANWGLTNQGTTVNGSFSITFESQLGSEAGSVNFRTSNHNITHKNVGTDSDKKDGSITNLVLDLHGTNNATVSLTSLELIYGNGSQKISLGSIAAGGGSGNNAWMALSNFRPTFAFGFTLTGNYSIIHRGSVGDESVRWELQALSGGSYRSERSAQDVAEPATLALFGAGIFGLAMLRRRAA